MSLRAAGVRGPRACAGPESPRACSPYVIPATHPPVPPPSRLPTTARYLGFFDAFFPLFGTLTIGILGLYLLLAASKGAAKFGTRFFLISVHALEPHKTLLNSFMFNVQLVLLCVLPTVQFCTDAFSQYARNTDAEVIFGSQFKYIYGFRYFWQYNVFLCVRRVALAQRRSRKARRGRRGRHAPLGCARALCAVAADRPPARACPPALPPRARSFTILGFTLLSGIYFGLFPSDRTHLNNVMAKIKAEKSKEMKAFSRKLEQQGGALSLV